MLSTAGVSNIPVGEKILPGQTIPNRTGFIFPYRLIGFEPEAGVKPIQSNRFVDTDVAIEPFVEHPGQSLEQLGILEGDHLVLEERFPIVRGQGQLDEALAVCEMVALHQQVPFRRDAISKVLESQFRRDKTLSLELLAALLELLGLNCQLGDVDSQFILSVEAPALFLLEGVPVVLYANSGSTVVIGHPHRGLVRESAESLQDVLEIHCALLCPAVLQVLHKAALVGIGLLHYLVSINDP